MNDFTRKRSRNESRSLVAARASTIAEENEGRMKEVVSWKGTNRYHVRSPLFEELIEQQGTLLVFEHFEEDHDELFAILLSSKVNN